MITSIIVSRVVNAAMEFMESTLPLTNSVVCVVGSHYWNKKINLGPPERVTKTTWALLGPPERVAKFLFVFGPLVILSS